MLAFFRRALGSWIVIGLLGLVVIAFIVTGVGGGLNGLGGGATSDPDVVATVGSDRIPAAEVTRRAQGQLNDAKQQQPGLTMAQFLPAIGGIDRIVEQVAIAKQLEVWAAKTGLTASQRLIDAEIVAIPAFHGFSGSFDEQTMRAVLAQQRMTLDGLRDGIRADMLRRQLLVPMTSGVAMPQGVARAYAALMLSRRIGAVAFVPLDPAAVAAPSATDIDAWYKTHLPIYSLPERRILKYALMDPDSVPVSPPTDADIAAQYKTDAAKYTASETRTLGQVVIADEKAARAFADKVAAGTPFAKAATDAGFADADVTLGKQTRDQFTKASTPAVADAVFAARQGATVGPIKSPLGWHIVHVDAVTQVAAQSLAQVHDAIRDALLAKKRSEALTAIGQKVEDALSSGANFDEIVKANGLKPVTTPPLTAAGIAPTDPAFKPDATIAALLKTGFQAAPGDDPTVETIGKDHYALLALGQILAGAPVPLDQARPRVTTDLVASRAAAAARATAQAVVAKANKGAALDPLLAAAKLKPAQPANASQFDALRLQQQVPPPLRLLFQLTAGKTGLVAAPEGYFIVRLDHIEEGDPKGLAPVAGQLGREFSTSAGNELVEQFARAIGSELPIRRNPAAVAALARQLSGQGGSAGQ
jgi:peptidyl-prolyl cis-trans isomerase D